MAPPKPANTPTYSAASVKPPVVPPKPDFVSATFGVIPPTSPEPAQKVEKPKADTSGVAVGVTVQHKMFGAGKVIELGDGLITVAFEQGQKRFEFPSAFDNGFLKI